MARKTISRVQGAALFLGVVGIAMAAFPVRAEAQVAVGHIAENPADALARNIKQLATEPQDFYALIGAGKAALALGDTQAAAGFFGRAEEVWGESPLPQIGMGAALVHEGNPAGGLQYFARAGQLGATPMMLGAERGLAYDLLGQHAQAQRDYRAAMAGPDHEEARRRLSLSLAITGNKTEAIGLLAPLMAKGDAAAARCRALILALTGDVAGARVAIQAAMPGAIYQMDPFLKRLSTLRSDQKAAAVHLGIFPGSSGQQMAYSSPSPSAGDRLSSIDQLLARQSPATVAAPPPAPRARVETGSAARQAQAAAASQAAIAPSRLWLQLASGTNADSLPQEFQRIKARERQLFRDIAGYVAVEPSRARLLIGPFRNAEEAGIFEKDLATVRIPAFKWTSPAGQTVRKIATE